MISLNKFTTECPLSWKIKNLKIFGFKMGFIMKYYLS